MTSVLLFGCILPLAIQSEAVPPGFINILASIEELLCKSERLVNTNSPAVVESVVNRLQQSIQHINFLSEFTMMQKQEIYQHSIRNYLLF